MEVRADRMDSVEGELPLPVQQVATTVGGSALISDFAQYRVECHIAVLLQKGRVEWGFDSLPLWVQQLTTTAGARF